MLLFEQFFFALMLQFDFFVIDLVLIEAATDLYVPAKKEEAFVN